MAVVLKQVYKFVKSRIKSSDLYGKKISMTYWGEDSFKTTYGGIISLLIKLIVFAYACILISVIFKRGDTKKTLNTTIKDLTNDKTKHYVGKGSFAFAISYKEFSSNTNFLMDSTYFVFTLQNMFYTRNLDGTVNVSSSEIPFDYWRENFKFVTDKNQYDRAGLREYICPTTDDFYLASDFFGEESANVEIGISKWVNTTENGNHCKSDSEIEQKISSKYGKLFD